MGLFNRKYDLTSSANYTPQNEQEAWIAIMHACIAVDEDVADEELEELAETLANKEMFEGHNVREYYKRVLLAHAKIGSKHMIDISVEHIPAESKLALFDLTIELLLADGVLADREEELIRYLTSALDIEEHTANSIVRRKLDHFRGDI